MREQNWTNKWRQRGAGYTCQSMSRSPFSLLHLHWLCLFDHPQLPSPILLYLFVLCVPKRVINLTDSRVENREKERERERGKSLGKLWEMGGSAKQIWILHTKILYFFADSTHSYDFLWFLSFHSPLHRYCNSCNLNYIHLSGKLFFLGS